MELCLFLKKLKKNYEWRLVRIRLKERNIGENTPSSLHGQSERRRLRQRHRRNYLLIQTIDHSFDFNFVAFSRFVKHV